MAIFFTSDLHLSHKTLINVRGLGKNHDKILIEEINKCVKEKDVLYHIGDFAPRNSAKYIADLIDKINCNRIHFIKGNHDQKLGEALTFFHDGRKKLTLKENDKISISDENNESYQFYLSHYPHFSWPGSNRSVKLLHGHSHSKGIEKFDKWIFSERNRTIIDCGVDAAHKLLGRYKPFSLDDIKKYINKEI